MYIQDIEKKKKIVGGEREQGREGKKWEWGGNWKRVKERRKGKGGRRHEREVGMK